MLIRYKSSDKNGPMQVYIILAGCGCQDSALANNEYLGCFEEAAVGLNTEQNAEEPITSEVGFP